MRQYILIHGAITTFIEDVSFTCYGPYSDLEAVYKAEHIRENKGLPVKVTPENNEIWSEAGHWFGIVELVK